MLCPHKHPVRGIRQGLQHLNTPGYEWQRVNVWVQRGFTVMIKLIGSCMVRVVLGFPPCRTEPLQFVQDFKQLLVSNVQAYSWLATEIDDNMQHADMKARRVQRTSNAG